MNKLARMSSVCVFNIVVTLCPCKGHFLPVVCWIWLIVRSLSASFSIPTSVARSSYLKISYKASICTMEMSKCYRLLSLSQFASILPSLQGLYLSCYQRLPGSTYFRFPSPGIVIRTNFQLLSTKRGTEGLQLFLMHQRHILSSWAPPEKQKYPDGCDLSCPFTALYMVVSLAYCGIQEMTEPQSRCNLGERERHVLIFFSFT